MTEPDFTIVIDRAESKRWPYSFPNGVRTIIADLPASYSVLGFADYLAIKRVTAEQLFAGCGTNRDLFEVELERLAAIPSAYLVLETTLEGIFSNPPPESRMKPAAVASSVLAWVNRLAIAVVPAGPRESAERWTMGIINRWWHDATQGALARSAERRAKRMAREVQKQFPQPVEAGKLPLQPGASVQIGIG